MDKGPDVAVLMRILPVLLLVATAPFAGAETPCGLPPSMAVLMARLEQVATSGTNLSEADRRQVSKLAARFDKNEVFGLMAPEGLIGQWNRVQSIIEDTEGILRSGRVSDAAQLSHHLRDARELDQMLCQKQRANQQIDLQENSGSGIGNRNTARLSVRLFDAVKRITPVSSVFVVIGLSILLLYGIDLLSRRFRWWMHNRMLCHIPAAIEIGLDVIDGYIIALGKQDCRFQPVNQGAFLRLAGLAHTVRATIHVGGQTLRVRAVAGGLGEGYGDYRFDTALSQHRQEDLLSASLISPYSAYDARRRKERAPPKPKSEKSAAR